MKQLLEVEGLNIDIATDRALLHPVIDVDLSVSKGQALAIVGESGSGKSLTAMGILGLLPRKATVTARRVRFAGESLQKLSKREWRSIRGDRIAMIFQDPMTALDPCYTIGEQMIEVLSQHRKTTGQFARSRVLEVLKQARVPSPTDRFKQYPHELSGGLRQRVMIAMALLCEPELLIADEPTTALDVTTQAQILKLLDDIRRQSGVGLILITHDIGVVANVADYVAVMYLGQIVEYGTMEQVLNCPLHPYTEGLLRSIPVPGRVPRRSPLGFIPGVVPPPVNIPDCCAFAPRCPYAMEQCRAAPVSLREAEDAKHMVRCVLPVDGSGRDPSVWNQTQAVNTP